MVLSLMPVMAFAAPQKIGDSDVTWELTNNNTVLTISGTGAMPDFRSLDSIPWNSQKAKIQTITIQSGVTSIGSAAFQECTNLISVTIPAGVTSIGTSAFNQCTSLAEVTIPSSVTSIGKSAFQGCTSLATVSFAETPMLESIGDQAFVRTRLTSITIPANVTEIGTLVFDQCASLQSIDVNINNIKYTSDGGVLFNKEKSTLICYPPAKTGTKYAIPDTVTSIGNHAFYQCKNLTKVEISSTVTSIGSSVFYECTNLATVSFAETPMLESIGDQAFGKTSLTSITIPASVAEIGNAVFSNCASLTSIQVNDANTAFESVDGVLFNKDKSKLICYPPAKTGTVYTIPNTVTLIGERAFQSCSNLTKIEIPSTVKSIGARAFQECKNLTSVEIPENVSEIKIYTFYLCTSLAAVKISSSVTSIASSAFQECKNLTSVKIPSSVTEIANNAFKGCSNLASVISLAAVPPTLNATAFDGCVALALIKVPADSVDAYNTATGWSTHANKIVGEHIVDGVIFEPWEDDDSLPETAGNYYLATDVEISSTWDVPTGATPTNLDLNGHVIKADTTEVTFSAITVTSGAILNIYDCGTTEHYFTVGDGDLWTITNEVTENVLTGGCITGGTGTKEDTATYGGGVNVCGTLNMYGGNIVGNKSTGNSHSNHLGGGGVYVNGGTLNMYGGSIVGNCALSNGGGVHIDSGTFNMEGGSIDSNKTSAEGGGVYVEHNGTFTMTGDSIISNNKGNVGAGVSFHGNTFVMSGNSKIKGNLGTSYGGGVRVNNGSFTMSENSEIAYNTGTVGGGVFIYNSTFTMTGGSINNNTATGNGGYFGGGVYNNGNVTLGGTAKITGNKKTDGMSDNFYLPKDKTITLATGTDIPTSGMSVGVTTQTVPTTVSPVAITANNNKCDVSYFASDNTAYKVATESNCLVLKLNPIITFDKNEGTCASESAITSAEGKLAVLPIATRNGYTFNGWYTTTTDGIQVTTSTVFTSDTTIYAQWSEIPDPPAPSYDSGSSSSTVTVPVTGDENTVKVSATVSGNTATVKKINDADLEKVTEGESVSIDLSTAGKNVDTAKIPTETVEKIAEKSSMTVKLPVATVEFDKSATEEIADQAKGSNIELVVDDVKEVSLNAVQKEAVGKLDTAIIIDAHLASNGSRLCTADNGGFGGGSAKVILPYEIKNNRKPENYSVFYVNEAGKLEKLNAAYDEELKAFVFEIEHFSVYAVAFEEFVDIDTNAYYYDAVKWAAANGVTDGIDDTHFDPNGITNRAQMVTFLWKAAGRPEPTISETPFTDLNPNRYYFKAVLWAYEKGITDGTTETTFEPDMNVSRAQVVTFLWRYSGKLYVDYWMQMTDVESGKYYTEAVRWALAEKITEGTTTTTFSPNDDCLRGQIVTFLYRDFAK